MHNIATYITVKFNRKKGAILFGEILKDPIAFDSTGTPYEVGYSDLADTLVYFDEGVFVLDEIHYVPASSVIDIITGDKREKVLDPGESIEVDSVEEAKDIVISQEQHLSNRNILKAAFTIEKKEKGKVTVKRLV